MDTTSCRERTTERSIGGLHPGVDGRVLGDSKIPFLVRIMYFVCVSGLRVDVVFLREVFLHVQPSAGSVGRLHPLHARKVQFSVLPYEQKYLARPCLIFCACCFIIQWYFVSK